MNHGGNSFLIQDCRHKLVLGPRLLSLFGSAGMYSYTSSVDLDKLVLIILITLPEFLHAYAGARPHTLRVSPHEKDHAWHAHLSHQTSLGQSLSHLGKKASAS